MDVPWLDYYDVEHEGSEHTLEVRSSIYHHPTFKLEGDPVLVQGGTIKRCECPIVAFRNAGAQAIGCKPDWYGSFIR